MHRYFFRLNISYSECAQVYQADIPSVILHSESGKRVQLASRHLRRFLTTSGIHGRFRLITDENNKFVSFEKIS